MEESPDSRQAGVEINTAVLTDIKMGDDVGSFLMHRFEGCYDWFPRRVRNVSEGYIDGYLEAGVYLRVGVEGQYEDWLGYLGPPARIATNAADIPATGALSCLHVESGHAGDGTDRDEVYVFVVPVKIVNFVKDPITVVAPIWFQRKDIVSVGVRKLPYFFLNSRLVEKLPCLGEWKVDARGRFSVSFGESACKIVENGTEIMKGFAKNGAQSFGGCGALNEIVANATFFFDGDVTGISLSPVKDGGCQIVDLFLGPIQSNEATDEVGTTHINFSRI